MTASDFEREFTLKQLQSYNSEIRSKYNSLQFNYNLLVKNQEKIIAKEVKNQTKNLNEELKNKDKIIADKDKQIEALKMQIAKMQLKLDTDSSNSGLPTSKTPINKKKLIPNTREKSDKSKGGQKGHPKHKLIKFKEEEITEEVEIEMDKCPSCGSEDIQKLNTSVDKDELDYDVKVIKRRNKFINYKCNICGKEFHRTIPNDLKEENQYGKTVQSLAVCLTNEIYTPFNKTVKLVSGITNGEINLSEGYVTKLQKRASGKLDLFIDELTKYFPKQSVYGWDEGVIKVNTKDAYLRVYCTDLVVLINATTSKSGDDIKNDGILTKTSENTIVMHDHITFNYNEDFQFENVECMIHLIRRLKKSMLETENANHTWQEKLIKLLSKTNKDRNKLLKDKKESFDNSYLENLDKTYDEIINEAKVENDRDAITINYGRKEETNFIEDLIKYKKNYLLWAYKFYLPSTNNNSERSLRPSKSKMKISGQFQSITYAEYYARIRSYIETCKRCGINIIDACVRLMDDKPYTLDEILKHEEAISNQKKDR